MSTETGVVIGDPHFLLFDGSRLDWDGKAHHWHLLWSANTKIYAYFEPLYTKETEDLNGLTFIGRVIIYSNGEVEQIDKYSSYKKTEENRGLPEEFSYFKGDYVGTTYREYKDLDFKVTCIELGGQCYLNLFFKSKVQIADGAIGQSLSDKRKDLSSFIFEEPQENLG